MKRDDWEDDWWSDPDADDFRECHGCHRMFHMEDVDKDEMDRWWCFERACREECAENRREADWQAAREKRRPAL